MNGRYQDSGEFIGTEKSRLYLGVVEAVGSSPVTQTIEKTRRSGKGQRAFCLAIIKERKLISAEGSLSEPEEIKYILKPSKLKKVKGRKNFFTSEKFFPKR